MNIKILYLHNKTDNTLPFKGIKDSFHLVFWGYTRGVRYSNASFFLYTILHGRQITKVALNFRQKIR